MQGAGHAGWCAWRCCAWGCRAPRQPRRPTRPALRLPRRRRRRWPYRRPQRRLLPPRRPSPPRPSRAFRCPSSIRRHRMKCRHRRRRRRPPRPRGFTGARRTCGRRGWPPPTPWRWMPDWKFSARAARPSTPRSPCRRCWDWSSRRARASAAASFLLYYDARTGKVSALDGREKAPAAAPPDMFLDEHGKPLPFVEAVRSGRSTGVPGAIAMLASAQAKFGALRWKELFQPAIRAASAGFRVPARLAMFLGEGSPFPPTNEVRTLFSRPDGADAAGGRPVPESGLRADPRAHRRRRAARALHRLDRRRRSSGPRISRRCRAR